jgi:hypothetical protein
MDQFDDGAIGSAPIGGAPSGAAARRVNGPATAMMVVGGLYIVLGLCGIASNIFVMTVGQSEQFVADPQVAQAIQQQSGISAFVGLFLAFALGAVQIFGGMQMKKLQNHTLAIVGAIAGIIPCSICCVFGLPVGVWALVTLLDEQVKAAFSS